MQITSGSYVDLSGVNTKLDTIDDYVDTEILDIKAATDRIGIIVNTDGAANIGALFGDFANITLVARLNAIDDFIDSEIAALQTALEGGTDAVNRAAGKTQFKTTAVTSAANAGDVTMATVTTQPCYIKSVVVHSDGVTTADLTSVAVKGGEAKVITLISSTAGAVANINAQDEQVWWEGKVYLPAAATIVMTLTGTGATAVDLNCVIEYEACVNGGYLA